MKFFPASYYFDRETEASFRSDLIEKTTPITEISALLVSFILFVFFVLDLLNWNADLLIANTLRLYIVIVLLGTVIANRTIGKKRNKEIWLVGAGLLTVGFLGVFYFSAIAFFVLGPGGPMLVVIGFAMLPVLDLREKLLVWLSMGVFLFWMSTLGSISMPWVTFYYGFSVILVFILQYQFDLLLRVQYRAELIEAEKAMTDELTGAFNRHGFEEYVKQELAGLSDGNFLHVAMLDIDHFKAYNDHYGHLEGDRVLTKIARALTALDVDRVIRFGGEEFIIVDRSDLNNPNWVKTLNEKVSSLSIKHEKSMSADVVTVSMGVVSICAGEHIGMKQILSDADELLYKVKNDGRNNYMRRWIGE